MNVVDETATLPSPSSDSTSALNDLLISELSATNLSKTLVSNKMVTLRPQD